MQEKLNVVYVKIEDLKPAEYNPRFMTPKQAEHLQTSLDEFGLLIPLIVNSAKERKNTIIGGHQRYHIEKGKGVKELPVVYVNIPSIEKEKELNARLNKNTGSWDWDMLANYDPEFLIDVGFDAEEIEVNFDNIRMDSAIKNETLDQTLLDVIVLETPNSPRLKARQTFYTENKAQFDRIKKYFETDRDGVLNLNKLLELIK